MNRGAYAYKKAKAEFFESRELWGGCYTCDGCGGLTQQPQLDHKERVGMGGSASRIMNTGAWQILCGAELNNCHGKKDSGLKFK